VVCAACSSSYPIVDGTPILIDPERSVFRPEEIVAEYERERAKPSRGLLGRTAWAIASRTPHVTSHRRQEAIAKHFADRLARERPSPSILVVGSGTEGIGIERLRAIPGATICEFDVYLTDRRMLVADLLDVPFEPGAFDAVVAQGVLEHVIDPQRGADEIHRVLAPGGLLFSTTPFVLGVHLPVADYTRFSRLGLIRLFRRFTPLECDAIEGAAVALAYSLAYFWMAVWSSFGWLGGAKLAKYAGNYLIFWLRFIDALVRRSPVSMDAAASYYYIGRRSETALSDREIVAMFKGVGLCPW
jgi:SAM-dependent methyltransferase